MVSTCQHVHYFSNQCTFREFPGCFECDVNNPYYKVALYFHWFCSSVAALSCILFITKVILAPQVVWDMLKNPTTSTPAGVFCIAMVCTFAGYGLAGEAIVLITSCFHVILAFWFLWMAFFQFRLWPDPGWFPNVSFSAPFTVVEWILNFMQKLTLSSHMITTCTVLGCGDQLCRSQDLYLLPYSWFDINVPVHTLLPCYFLCQRHSRLSKSQDCSSSVLDSAVSTINYPVRLDFDFTTYSTRGIAFWNFPWSQTTLPPSIDHIFSPVAAFFHGAHNGRAYLGCPQPLRTLAYLQDKGFQPGACSILFPYVIAYQRDSGLSRIIERLLDNATWLSFQENSFWILVLLPLYGDNSQYSLHDQVHRAYSRMDKAWFVRWRTTSRPFPYSRSWDDGRNGFAWKHAATLY